MNRAYIVKIADFGLARDMDDDGDYYTIRNQRPMPIRWMAIEAILNQKWSVLSDVVSRTMECSIFDSICIFLMNNSHSFLFL